MGVPYYSQPTLLSSQPLSFASHVISSAAFALLKYPNRLPHPLNDFLCVFAGHFSFLISSRKRRSAFSQRALYVFPNSNKPIAQ